MRSLCNSPIRLTPTVIRVVHITSLMHKNHVNEKLGFLVHKQYVISKINNLKLDSKNCYNIFYENEFCIDKKNRFLCKVKKENES